VQRERSIFRDFKPADDFGRIDDIGNLAKNFFTECRLTPSNLAIAFIFNQRVQRERSIFRDFKPADDFGRIDDEQCACYNFGNGSPALLKK
jgi:hypothetical protein